MKSEVPTGHDQSALIRSAVLIGMAIAGFSVFQAGFLPNAFQNLLALTAGFLLIYSLQKSFRDKTAHQLSSIAILAGIAVSGFDLLFSAVLNGPAHALVAGIFCLPLAVTGAYAASILAYRARSRFGVVVISLLLGIVFLLNNPYFIFATITALVVLSPFRWRKELASKHIYRLGLFSLALILVCNSHHLLNLDLNRTVPSSWSFIASGFYSVAFSLIRALAWFSAIYAVVHPLKPRRIRTRLRWAFLLNFLIPTTLITGLFLVSMIWLLGGYQIASAKRLLFRIGMQAHQQSILLWEAANGVSREAPSSVPYHRAGIVKFPDGSIQTFRNPPFELLEKLEDPEIGNAEFVSVDEPKWELWVAGFYRAEDGSGAAIAYRVDHVMLDYLHDVLGFHFALTPGLDWSFLPFFDPRSDERRIATIPDTNEDITKFLTIGAIMISQTNMMEIQETNSSITLKPYATLSVLVTRKTLAESLVSSGKLSDFDLVIGDTPGQFQLKLKQPDVSKIDIQSMNFLNFMVFILLSIIGGLLVGMIILSLSTSMLISRKINRSLLLIKEGTSQLRHGNLDHQIPVTTNDELGELAADFNMMAASLRTFQTEREQFLLDKLERERLHRELETARQIQQSLLPQSDPNVDTLEIAGICKPMAEVGGDYFDYIYFPDGCFGLAIGDVSGHGMSAGLLMSMAKSCLYNQVQVSPDVSDVMRAMNSMIYGALRQKLLMTFLYAMFSQDARKLTFASAGHHFPYVRKAKTGQLKELVSVSYPLGVRRNIRIQIQEAFLDPGDLLIFYTDGIIETQNLHGELFGFERFEKCIMKYHDLPVDQIRDKLMETLDVFRHGTEIQDDMTVIAIRVKDI